MATMDQAREFFCNPQSPTHRRYEMLRAQIVDRKPVDVVAADFHTTPYTVKTYKRNFYKELDKGTPPLFFAQPKPGPKSDRKKPLVRDHIVRLRALRYADTDIHRALQRSGMHVSLSLVNQVLREEGLSGLGRRTVEERLEIGKQIEQAQVPGLNVPVDAAPIQAEVADARALDLTPGRTLDTRTAGIFLFTPFLVKADLGRIVAEAGLPGSAMIPPASYLLSLLTLKLLDKERKGHIDDFSFDEAQGLSAGLNVLPKITAATDYSYRLNSTHYSGLLTGWVRATFPILCPEGASSFAIDCHTIEHRGEGTGLEKNYIPSRNEARTSILTCFARAIESPMLCYANADITHHDKPSLPLQFADYWHKITGLAPEWLYMDCTMTNHPTLSALNAQHISFVTIRRRGEQMVQALRSRRAAWKTFTIDTPQRRHQKLSCLDQNVKLRGYSGTCRQIAIEGSRENPTIYLTNNKTASAREIVCRYINRNTIENDLGNNVNFFHLDCLASEVRLNVNLDVVLTVIANACYRWLGSQLKGCTTMQPKQLYRKFVETSGHVSIREDDLLVTFDRRSHNPILQQAALDAQRIPVPWLGGRRLSFRFT